jgi:ribosomal protein S18 acetylase RimI-like enzyme
MSEVTILRALPTQIDSYRPSLAGILSQSVALGAAVGFVLPFSQADAEVFWTDIAQEVAAGDRCLWIALQDGQAVGTVQLVTALPPNQAHRCEIAKMVVAPQARRQGIARRLMTAALEYGSQLGKTLVTLDTRTGDAAEPLYASLGFETAGVIPNFAQDADRSGLHGTTYMYRALPLLS